MKKKLNKRVLMDMYNLIFGLLFCILLIVACFGGFHLGFKAATNKSLFEKNSVTIIPEEEKEEVYEPESELQL